ACRLVLMDDAGSDRRLGRSCRITDNVSTNLQSISLSPPTGPRSAVAAPAAREPPTDSPPRADYPTRRPSSSHAPCSAGAAAGSEPARPAALRRTETARAVD